MVSSIFTNTPLTQSELRYIIRVRKPLFDQKFPLVLMWSEKSGCTTVVQWFFWQINELENARNYSSWIHNYENYVFKKREDYYDELQSSLVNQDKPLIKFVRNPFQRAVSSYLLLLGNEGITQPNHFVSKTWPKIRLHFYGSETDSRGISFRNYLHWLQANGVAAGDVNNHFAQQYIEGEEHLSPRYVKIEDMANVLATLENEAGLPRGPEFLYGKQHQSPYGDKRMSAADEAFKEGDRNRTKIPNWKSFYDLDTINMVRDLFSADFSLYEYNTNLDIDA
ncbi:hypothetical protein E2A64_06460 [Pseudohoeflea suaedae]|uniref:Sulfotransferase family protein n=1 Tax=Pseudohoeflea suaedae TaxID=877384 RepID=A0A4R5PNU2_9HYPH|nr:sulfotransferase family 2 domain-containing protein [Pseudohoeflea suaedae]TDH38734.1 hypothetical protein E2A64_06460 [Pseudohoeflea suaedae]